ncbi:MAG: alpha/beta fold hydrolase, partial [Pseudomonadales bacterium]|nr:alpha/beta fold hydrolase [Pseudomonadales bacterium]
DRAVETVCARLDELHASTGEKTTLIGWSLGGVFSRAIASEAQSKVKQVITLGSPFGDPRSVIVYPLLEKLKKRSMTQAHLDDWFAMCNAPLGKVAITNLYSRTDGFVPSEVAHNFNHHLQEIVHVFSSHVGFAVNPMVLYLIAKRLHHSGHHWSAMQAEHPLEKILFSMNTKNRPANWKS